MHLRKLGFLYDNLGLALGPLRLPEVTGRPIIEVLFAEDLLLFWLHPVVYD